MKQSILFAALLLCASAASAQVEEEVYRTDYAIDTARVRTLWVELDNLSFFKDNEYTSEFMRGYTLPGLWLQPKVVYYPLKNLKVELGLHALIYSGANKYPSMAYRDIAYWKGNQYQKGAHLLPYFRAQVTLSKVNLVIGNLYGRATHRLIEPQYNPEITMTADPEMGFQFLFDSRSFHLDVWVNWESYIFQGDTHQEAFTVGLSSQIDWTPRDASFHVYSPVQGTIQHRGGEQDTIYTNSVQTLTNGAVGAGITWNAGRRVLRRLNVEADVLGYYQQMGELWRYNNGWAFYTALSADLRDVRVRAGYFRADDFISLFGLPYFGAASTRHVGAVFDRPQTVFASVEYARTFAKHYAFGARAELYQSFPGQMTDADGAVSMPEKATCFSVGVYFRVNPEFLVKKWK